MKKTQISFYVFLILCFFFLCPLIRRFTSHGIDHIELYFLDGSNPPDHILAKFLQVVEDSPGAVAVHCKAGLGRTGCCIGSYMMKHLHFTAEEVMGWLRIVRPGSIIGPQQNWIKEMQVLYSRRCVMCICVNSPINRFPCPRPVRFECGARASPCALACVLSVAPGQEPTARRPRRTP